MAEIPKLNKLPRNRIIWSVVDCAVWAVVSITYWRKDPRGLEVVLFSLMFAVSMYILLLDVIAYRRESRAED